MMNLRVGKVQFHISSNPFGRILFSAEKAIRV